MRKFPAFSFLPHPHPREKSKHITLVNLKAARGDKNLIYQRFGEHLLLFCPPYGRNRGTTPLILSTWEHQGCRQLWKHFSPQSLLPTFRKEKSFSSAQHNKCLWLNRCRFMLCKYPWDSRGAGSSSRRSPCSIGPSVTTSQLWSTEKNHCRWKADMP